MWFDKNKQKQFSDHRAVHWNETATKKTSKSRYYQKLLARYYRFYVPENSRILEIGSGNGKLLHALKPSMGVGIDLSKSLVDHCKKTYPDLTFHVMDAHNLELEEKFDFIILSDLLNDVWDAQWILKALHENCTGSTRIIINTHNRLWQPALKLAENLGLATHSLQQNWLARDDIVNLLNLEDYDIVKTTTEVLLPLNIPLLSWIFNRYLAKLSPFKIFDLVHFIVARPTRQETAESKLQGVSVIVAARNEEGNIPALFERIPQMGSGTEIIFVEGGSSDDTYGAIEREIANHPERNVKLLKQPGKGKGDAVRVGFANASQEILMILDADMTVSPEDLPRFYEAIVSGKGEFINGVRLVYPMEKEAMRFFNLLGNKGFSMVFSWILGQQIKDTLCGTKVLKKANYELIAANRSYFGEFDPFGDFDLIFGAAKQNLKIVDMPIRYSERTYGNTNIARWSSGVLLLRMAIFAAKRLKFV